jgi:hypothetical protein
MWYSHKQRNGFKLVTPKITANIAGLSINIEQ